MCAGDAHRPAPIHYNYFRDYDPAIGRYVESDPIGLDGGPNTYAYVGDDPLIRVDPSGEAFCLYSIRAQRMSCISKGTDKPVFDAPFSSGNNGGGMRCKDNPKCTPLANRGPIPQGLWTWTSGYTAKPNGRVLVPNPGTNDYGRTLFRTHSCFNPFGPATKPPYCSEGCVTGSAPDVKRLNRLLDAEPGSILLVTD